MNRADKVSFGKLSERIGAVAGDVRQVFREERGEDYDTGLVADAIRSVMANKLEMMGAGLSDMFTSPARIEFQELAGVLERLSIERRADDVEQAVGLAEEFGDDSVFTGRRLFAPSKMAAMIEYLTAKGHHVYKTSLNKLLFYSDLTNFYLTNSGISGAVYHNRPYGPVAAPAEPILNELVRNEKVSLLERTKTLEAASPSPDVSVLTDDERKVLDWVAETYGCMSAGEVSEFSHREMAYKNTQPNEPIAYAYAQFFKHLPPKDLLDQ